MDDLIADALQTQCSPQDSKSWRRYWKARRQPWRSEPEITQERQEYLAQQLEITPNIEKGIYPFKGIKLSRADLEWLLEAHQDGKGPIDWRDQSRRERDGVDLRGADLRGVDLRHLPLARLLGGLTWDDWEEASTKQRAMAAILLQGANLRGAHLESARFRGAHLEKANLPYTYLEAAQFRHAYIAQTNFEGAFFLGTDLEHTRISDDGIGPQLVDVHWRDTDLTSVHWHEIHILGDEAVARQADSLKGYEDAVRAYRQVTVALQSQGLNEDAARCTYRAQVLQRKVHWKRKSLWKWLGSMVLALTAGYGARMWRTLTAYVFIVLLYALAYYVLGSYYSPHLSLLDSIHTSLTAFHGRVFSDPFLLPSEPEKWLTATEGIAGLLLESIFIAMLTQKFIK